MTATLTASSHLHTPQPSPAGFLLGSAAVFLIMVVLRTPLSGPIVNFDGFASAICALIVFVSAAVAAFSWRHMRASRFRAFAMHMVALVACALGFVIADHVALFAACWIASGLLLARLIGHADNWPAANRASRSTARIFMAADAALLTGLALLCWRLGTSSIEELMASVSQAPRQSAEINAGALAIAALTRCAIPPVSGWLLSSMTAPTPVSALMHAGLVNAGGVLVLRFAPLLEAAPFVRISLVAIGAAGALYGAGIMLVRPDVKRALAGSTVSQMSFMMMSCALGAYSAALWHLLAHGLFKAWLFLGAGMTARTPQAKTAASVPVVGALAATGITMAALVTAGVIEMAQPSFVPLSLALLTALLATFSIVGHARRHAMARGVALIAALAGFQAAGLTMTRALVGADGPTIAPAAAQILIALIFASALAWQFWPRRKGPTMPRALYVHFLNAGVVTR
ncbi:proton-conducting transporter membrane subunit [Novosphingobium sp. 9U]|uniref:proton-conducting transporter transmembrane domain-containing protein n=1 Tax=Novosphingobium sp. 9U TaxID=2653158 RepID=UPI0012F0258C|nr:proton-conducting transporter membrane subunit [Novosphingobium sp. 9U]VWX48324.1 NADH dehydrogenase, subunit 5 [Novosphingobium sp. 9U]